MSKTPTFLDHVRNSGLVDVKRLTRLVDSLRVRKRIKQTQNPDYKSQLSQLKKFESYENLPQLERYVAREFLRLGWLNVWQISQLIEGRRRFTLGDYLIQDSLGQGGYAHVFLAESQKKTEQVALKVFQSSQSQPEVLTRFLREAMLQESISHEYIVRLISCGQDSNVDYLVFEYMAGRDVRRLIRDEVQLPIMQSVRIIMQAAEALAYLHEQGIVHRDIKPANILLTESGTAKLGDLGLCGFLDDRAESDPRIGKLVGTADYMAPEHILNPRKTSRGWDIYSLGCTFYQMVTGIVPFPKEDTREKIMAHLRSRLVDPRVFRDDLPEELAEIITRMMAKSPTQRFQSAEEVLKSLEIWCNSRTGDHESVREELRDEPKHVSINAETLRKLRDYSELALTSHEQSDDSTLRNQAVQAVSQALLSEQEACDLIMKSDLAGDISLDGISVDKDGFQVETIDLGTVNNVPLEKEIYELQKPVEEDQRDFSFELPAEQMDEELPTQFDQKSLFEFVSAFEEETRVPRWKCDGLSKLRRSLPLSMRLRFAKREVVMRRFARQMRNGYVLDPRCGGERSHIKVEPTFGWYVRWLLTSRSYEAYSFVSPPKPEKNEQDHDSTETEYLRVRLPGHTDSIVIEVPPVILKSSDEFSDQHAKTPQHRKRSRRPFEPLTLIFWSLMIFVIVSVVLLMMRFSF